MSKFNLSDRLKIPAKATIWYLGASAVAKGMGVITTPFFTRLLGGEEYGNIALYMSLLGGASVIVSAFSSGSSFYKGYKESGDNKSGFLRAALIVICTISIAFCILLFTLAPLLGLKPSLAIPLALQLLCDGITAILLSRARFNYQYRLVAAVTVVGAILPPTISIFALKYLGADYSVRIYSLLLVSAIIAIFAFISLMKIQRGMGITKIGKEEIKNVLLLALPMLPHAIWSAVSLQADKLVMTARLGPAALGKYSVIFSVGVALHFLVSAVGSAFFPWIIRRLDREETDRIREIVGLMFTGYAALGICIMAIAPEALAILAPKEYLDALPALLPLVTSTPLFFLSSVNTAAIVYYGKTKSSLIISLTSAVACIILNYTLIGKWGYAGAGVSYLLCQLISASLGMILLRREGIGQPIYLGRAILTLAISVTAGIICYRLWDSLVWRGVMLIIPLIMLLLCFTRLMPQITEKSGKTVP